MDNSNKENALPRGYVWLIRLIGLFSFIAFSAIVLKVDPESGVWTKVLFYISLFVFFGCFLNLIFLSIRKRMMGGEMMAYNITLSFRQGVLLSLLLVTLLILQSFRMLLWWDGLLAVAGVFLIELYFLTRE